MGMLAPERPQQPQLVTLQVLDAGRAILGSTDMDGRGVEINLLPPAMLGGRPSGPAAGLELVAAVSGGAHEVAPQGFCWLGVSGLARLCLPGG